MEGAQNLSSFDSAKAAHLERLSPEERAEIAFVMDMQDFSTAKKDMRNNGLDLQVVYHSHPHDPARPSITDIKIATDYEEIWPKINLPLPAYLLVSLMEKSKPDIRGYWIRGGIVTQAHITTLPSRLVKKAPDVVLGSSKSSTYPRGYDSGFDLPAALLVDRFDKPAGITHAVYTRRH